MKNDTKINWNKINIKAKSQLQSDSENLTELKNNIIGMLYTGIIILALVMMALTLWHFAGVVLSGLGTILLAVIGLGGMPTTSLSFSAIFIGKVVGPLLANKIVPSIIGFLALAGTSTAFGAYLAEKREQKFCNNLINEIKLDDSPNLKRVYAFMQDNQDKLSFELLQKPEILKEIISKGNIDLIKLVLSEPYLNNNKNNIEAYYNMLQQILTEPMKLSKLEVAKTIIISTLNSSISGNRSETKNFIRSVISMQNSDKLIEYMNVEENQIFSKVLTGSKSQILLNKIREIKNNHPQQTDIEGLPRQSPVSTPDKRSIQL